MSFGLHDSNARTLVIGAGVIGLSIAYELACRGRRVAIVDRGGYGQQASWAGVGILPPVATKPVADPLEQLRSLSHRLHIDWADRLRSETGIDTGFRQSGGVYLATTAGEAATLVGNQLWWEDLGISACRWTSAELVQHEPALAPGLDRLSLRDIWWLPEECQLRTPRHVRALAQACQQRGVELIEHTCVRRLRLEAGHARAAVTDGEDLIADQFCIAGGPWTRELLQPLGVILGILPIRGQILLFQLDKNLLRSIINEGHRYLVPRDDGRILVGSNEEEAGFAVETSQPVLAELREWAARLLPVLETAPLERAWAGLRPGSYDGFPYIGAMPDLPNVFVASGHYRAGIHLACGTASVLADLMLDGQCAIDLLAIPTRSRLSQGSDLSSASSSAPSRENRRDHLGRVRSLP